MNKIIFGYVEPEQFEHLRFLVTDTRDNQRPTGIVLHGFSGVGKTILALALARSEEVGCAFRDGILWVDGEADELSAEVRRKVGIDFENEEEWRKWP